MKEIIIEVPDEFGQELNQEKINNEIKRELVRCKDCKHGYEGFVPSDDYYCYWHDQRYNKEWFCADGERR